ncbi:phosphoglycolate phosphatase [Niveibacterium microcysteis]|uniref:phosphoglycolate phosphatase n=1 Tax=Niveibacterium microcysteis TaxID=2811415 RepID=A0ABX7MCL8_9RHOO|nr:phosphoglycolate phosphatase [Niveibacterium microcysteis]QSI78553.1 phosphoglycolate phosphatase [Niveibacterium microcysteis]
MTQAPTCCVLFDLDGTLADTAPDLGAALNHVLEEEGVALLPIEATRPVTSQGVRGLLRVGLGIGPDDTNYQTLAQRVLKHYAAGICRHTRLFDGMPGVLATLESRGIKWGIVTNKHARFTEPLVDALGLMQRAACVISGDSAAHPKPHPAPLLMACERANVAPTHSIYVGDDLRDIQAGKAAGMCTIAAAWGYLGEGEAIHEWGADHIAPTPEALLDVVFSINVQ